MNAGVQIVLGPTCSAKTERAVRLAKTLGTPVIAVDRIQVFDDLAATSGRPTGAELHHTRRWYLDHRLTPSSPEEMPAHEGLNRLERLMDRAGQRAVLEGGSISLWRAYFTERGPSKSTEIWQRLVTDWDRHAAAVRRRYVRMMTGTPSMLDELATTLGDPRARALVERLVGIDEAVAWCADRDIAPETLGDYRDDLAACRSLAATITPPVVDYARRQQAAFCELMDEYPHHEEVVR